MKIEFTRTSLNDIKKIDHKARMRIKAKLLWFANQSDPLVFAKKIKNSDAGTYRFRVGDYRIIFDLLQDVIIVLAIGHRRDIYDG